MITIKLKTLRINNDFVGTQSMILEINGSLFNFSTLLPPDLCTSLKIIIRQKAYLIQKAPINQISC